jgi:hypothetical protein
MANWRFERVPESEFERVLKAIEEKDIKTLYLIERAYSVSTTKYCCPTKSHLNWFDHGKQQGYFGGTEA